MNKPGKYARKSTEEIYISFGRPYGVNLSRLWRISQEGFGALSAFKKGLSDKENLDNHEKLKNLIRESGLGFFQVDGVYTYDNGEQERELSAFIPYKESIFPDFSSFEKTVLKFGKIFRFNQESVLIVTPDKAGNQAKLLYVNGRKKIIIGNKLGFDKIAASYSVLKKESHQGRSFVFEGVRIPQNHINAYGLIAQNILWF